MTQESEVTDEFRIKVMQRIGVLLSDKTLVKEFVHNMVKVFPSIICELFERTR